MTTEKNDPFAVVPLSQYRGHLRDFGRSYSERGAKRDVQIAADNLFLDGLHRALIVARRPTDDFKPAVETVKGVVTVRGKDADLSSLCVADLSAADLEESLESVLRSFPDWQLAGEDGEDIFDRVDRHFAPLHEAYMAAARDRAAHVQRVIRENEAAEERAVLAMQGARRVALEAELDALSGQAA